MPTTVSNPNPNNNTLHSSHPSNFEKIPHRN